ncbi:uncharacterized protein [Hoplias malabaricus]|uniref:uncharacterized protein n=1 Tax=Hoplias malabaricus TaxID=27720 RepID=UPI0034629ED7
MTDHYKDAANTDYPFARCAIPCATPFRTGPKDPVEEALKAASEWSRRHQLMPGAVSFPYQRSRLMNRTGQHLTEEDQGDYRCEVQGDTKDFRLHIKVREIIRPSTTPTDSTTHPPLEFTTITTSSSLEPPTGEDQSPFSIHQGVWIVILVLVLGAVVFMCWRFRGRSGQNVATAGHSDPNTQQENPAAVCDDVMYSTIAHSDKAAQVQINTAEQTVYARIKTK